MANIGIVTTWYECGAAYVSREYMRALQSKHNVFVYARGGHESSRNNRRWDLDNVTHGPRLHGPFCHSTDAISRWHFFRWLRSRQIDVVLFNEQQAIRIVRETSERGYVTGAYVDYYTDETVADFDVYDFLLCNTKRHYSVFKDHRKCLFLQWGTDTRLFRPTATRPPLEDGVVFFHSAGSGGISLRKGTDFLVHAFRRLRGRARLIIHSQAPAGKYGELQHVIKNDPRIEFIEKTVPAPGLFHLGNVYVYPSRLDGIGLSVPEALATGLPVITTDEPPMSEFVRNEYNGLLVQVSERKKRSDGYYWPESLVDVADLAGKMQFYVDHADVAAGHARNARRSAEEQFDWERNSAGLADWMNHLQAKHAVAREELKTLGKWCLFDLFLLSQGAAAGFTRRVVPSLKGRQRLKRLMRIS